MTWPTHGDFVRTLGGGYVHIAIKSFTRDDGDWWQMACGQQWSTAQLLPAAAEDDWQCSRCWESM